MLRTCGFMVLHQFGTFGVERVVSHRICRSDRKKSCLGVAGARAVLEESRLIKRSNGIETSDDRVGKWNGMVDVPFEENLPKETGKEESVNAPRVSIAEIELLNNELECVARGEKIVVHQEHRLRASSNTEMEFEEHSRSTAQIKMIVGWYAQRPVLNIVEIGDDAFRVGEAERAGRVNLLRAREEMVERNGFYEEWMWDREAWMDAWEGEERRDCESEWEEERNMFGVLVRKMVDALHFAKCCEGVSTGRGESGGRRNGSMKKKMKTMFVSETLRGASDVRVETCAERGRMYCTNAHFVWLELRKGLQLDQRQFMQSVSIARCVQNRK